MNRETLPRTSPTMKYWEVIAERLSASGWSWGIVKATDVNAGELFVVDAHRSDVAGRFIVRADDLLSAFLELERATNETPPLGVKPCD
jgi:hypothetical protein